ncbi:5-hydroxytryptamine receptor 2A-like [Limulus polyphemus]|uniref:5-hydroxytryptamine receptor 2A-like n=1 Tax=Limulus polyphemus TaxID=6850 RepID=A0ABM1BNB2_LIMPO|nr:5-hydroxytryptamine receptor 2A-like [Limulus polyphemus]
MHTAGSFHDRQTLTNTTEVSSFEISSLSQITVSVILGLLILTTVIGNLFVIAAIMIEKNLHSVGNYLVLSLAVADLMVACLVMPLSAVYEVTHEWKLDPELCDVWTSCDVLCCTASILHLLAIAMDRYWAITQVNYAQQRSRRRIGVLILSAWCVALVVSVAPVFGWKDAEFKRRIEVEKRCLLSQDLAYQIFATCSSFYLPLVVILILYWKIFQVARKRIRHKPGSKAIIVLKNTHSTTETCPNSPQKSSINTNGITSTSPGGITRLVALAKRDHKQRRESIQSRRERKAAKTLVIITGVFVICWLPFFVMALLMPICSSCELSDMLFSFFLWLGYINSMLNPIIYTIFSPDFQNAFKRILCGKKRTVISRPT